MTERRRIIVLVGPKGSGKTFIGGLLGRELGIRFLRVERTFLEIVRTSTLSGAAFEQEGYARVRRQLDIELATVPCVVIESTGASDAFPPFLAALRQQHDVLLVAVHAPLDTCLSRVRTRDQSEHIAVSDDRVAEINDRAVRVRLAWDLEIDNSAPAEPAQILTLFRELLARPVRG